VQDNVNGLTIKDIQALLVDLLEKDTAGQKRKTPKGMHFLSFHNKMVPSKAFTVDWLYVLLTISIV